MPGLPRLRLDEGHRRNDGTTRWHSVEAHEGAATDANLCSLFESQNMGNADLRGSLVIHCLRGAMPFVPPVTFAKKFTPGRTSGRHRGAPCGRRDWRRKPPTSSLACGAYSHGKDDRVGKVHARVRMMLLNKALGESWVSWPRIEETRNTTSASREKYSGGGKSVGLDRNSRYDWRLDQCFGLGATPGREPLRVQRRSAASRRSGSNYRVSNLR